MEYVASQIQRNLIYHKLYPLSISFFINTTIVSINRQKWLKSKYLLLYSNTTIVSINRVFSMDESKNTGNSNTTIVSINRIRVRKEELEEFKYNYCFY